MEQWTLDARGVLSVQFVHINLDVQSGNTQLLHSVEAHELWWRHPGVHVILSREHWRDHQWRLTVALLHLLAPVPPCTLAFFTLPCPRRQLLVQ